MRIALDAMGGDLGPELLIDGALSAIDKRRNLEVVLLGPEELLKEQVAQRAGSGNGTGRLSIVHAPQTVSMHESPVDAVRKKKDSTIMVGFDLVKTGKADAMVSAGNSGATMAAAVRKLGRLKGIARPGIASVFPTLKDPVMLMDIGANVDCRAQHLFQFAILGEAYAKDVLMVESPKVGLLSNGEEESKGNEVTKATFVLLKQMDSFIGNVEGNDIFNNSVDVVVCDGFVGNILLKTSEGVATSISKLIKMNIKRSPRALTGALLMRRVFKLLKKQIDYAEYGGAPLIGVNKPTIICHGKSNHIAIKNAIYQALSFAESDINEDIARNIASYKIDS